MKILAQNRRARHDYDIVDTFEAGLILTGQEVKSSRDGGFNLSGAYVSFFQDRPVLKNATIAPYRHASGLDSYEPGRERNLLLNKKEIGKLRSISDEQGVTIIPLEVKGGKHIKLVIGVGKGRKKYDKRQKKKEEDVSRRMKKGQEY